MLVGLQILARLHCKTNYWRYNTNTEGSREKLNKLCLVELSQKILWLVVAWFLSSNKTLSINTFNVNCLFMRPLKALIFHVFQEIYKRLLSWNMLKSIFLCVDRFLSVKPLWIMIVRKATFFLNVFTLF